MIKPAWYTWLRGELGQREIKTPGQDNPRIEEYWVLGRVQLRVTRPMPRSNSAAMPEPARDWRARLRPAPISWRAMRAWGPSWCCRRPVGRRSATWDSRARACCTCCGQPIWQTRLRPELQRYIAEKKARGAP